MSKETKKKGTKKPYQKPEIVFEDFSLTTNIAAGCEKKIDSPSQMQCGLNVDGMMLFLTGVTGCEFTDQGNGTDNDGYCYHTPTDENNIFNS